MLKRVPYAARETFLKLLLEARKEAGLSQAELAKRLGRPQNFVSVYERGVRRLDLLETREICKALGVSLSTFVSRLERKIR